MVRKTVTVALAAAGMIATIANFEGADANAQAATPVPGSTATGADITEEVLPVFVSSEVAQPLPDTGAESGLASPARSIPHTQPDSSPPSAASLRDLVDTMAEQAAMSEELRCLAGAIYFESRGEPLAGQLAVAQVVVNRAESSRFPSSYCGVVTQRSQFSFVRNGRIPDAPTGSAAWRKARAIAQIAHQGLWESEAGESLFFHARYVRPGWSRKKVAKATIDSHIFHE